MRKALADGQLRLANKIGKLMMHVYHGAKALKLSVNSFPPRVLVAEFANSFLYGHPKKSVPDLNLPYLSQNGNNELLNCILRSNRQKTFRSIGNTTSLRWITRPNTIDKICMLTKVISPSHDDHGYLLRLSFGVLPTPRNTILKTCFLARLSHN